VKLLSFEHPKGHSAVGRVVGDTIFDLTDSIPTPPVQGMSAMKRLLLSGLDDLDAWSLATGGAEIPLNAVSVLPVVPDPSKIVAAPVNYFDHQAEMNEDSHIDSLGVFLKAPSSVLADGGTVLLPYTDRRFDQEGEFAAVIGRTASHVSAADALHYVVGYTLLLDMTMRGGEDRSTRKSFNTFTPVGPWLVTPPEVGEIDELRLRTWVNGTLRQDANIKDLIWGLPRLIEYVSSVMTLQPGDIVTTGTPAGVGQVYDGESIDLEVTNLGRLHVVVSSSGAVECPTKGANRGPRPPETVTPVREQGR
jgi:2-keto-4-pentenoate hydratase/2-oxohepta-3-ene-1,7-dioic acid hydratase in catechol pathway